MLTQISVFIENRQGRLAHVAKILGDSGVNIYALSLADTADFGILRLIVSDVNRAKCTLKEHNIVCSTAEMIGIEVPEVPGSLSKVLLAIDECQLNVEYMYAMRVPSTQKSALVFRFTRPQEAVKLLQNSDLKFVGHQDILNNL